MPGELKYQRVQLYQLLADRVVAPVQLPRLVHDGTPIHNFFATLLKSSRRTVIGLMRMPTLTAGDLT